MQLYLRAIFAILATSIAHGQETPPIRVPVRLVLVPALVFSADGRIVNGLEAQDFSVFDNGVQQKIESQTDSAPPSIVIAIQANLAVSDYLPFVKKTGALLDSLLVGEAGRSAILAYGDEVKVAKAFGGSDASAVFSKLAVDGSGSRMLDAGMQAVSLLKKEEPSRPRILLFIGQAADVGSSVPLSELQKSSERENVTIHCLTLPIAGKKFVSDTFSLGAKDGSGFVAGVDLMKLVPALRKGSRQAAGEDPFSVLAGATGGTQIHFRKQAQLENGLIAVGTAIRSSYLLTYSPGSSDPGYHRLLVEVAARGDKVYSRPGYWRERE